MTDLLTLGARNRHVGETAMNIESSRSHSIFTLTIDSRKRTQNGVEILKQSRLNFVDLAGSERQKMTGAVGERLKEAGNISRTLTVFGLVINSLVEIAQGKQRHIPYRDSKLTFLLKDSLGGNSKTCVVATVSASSLSFQETLGTLRFAQRVKMIKNHAQINEETTGTPESMRKEILRLREELLAARGPQIDSALLPSYNQQDADLFERQCRLNERLVLQEELLQSGLAGLRDGLQGAETELVK